VVKDRIEVSAQNCWKGGMNSIRDAIKEEVSNRVAIWSIQAKHTKKTSYKENSHNKE